MQESRWRLQEVPNKEELDMLKTIFYKIHLAERDAQTKEYLAARANFFKSDEHGVMTMCKVIEEYAEKVYGPQIEKAREEGIAEKTLRTIRNQLKRRVAYADIASDNETTVDEVIRIAKESNLAY